HRPHPGRRRRFPPRAVRPDGPGRPRCCACGDKSMYQQYYEEPKYRPSFLAEPRVAAGLLGRKTGRGWYAYGKDGTAKPVAEPPAPKARPDSVWAVPELKELFPRIEKDPSQASVCFVA